MPAAMLMIAARGAAEPGNVRSFNVFMSHRRCAAGSAAVQSWWRELASCKNASVQLSQHQSTNSGSKGISDVQPLW